MTERVRHNFEPFWTLESRVLILGSMPSPASRAARFFYGHPLNRFWTVLPQVFGEGKLETIEEKKDFLTRRRIALWDVLASCEIEGAEDASIRNPVANDIARILRAAPIRAVFTTGGTATKLYRKLCLPAVGRDTIGLPSTSPANQGRWKLPALVEAYGIIREKIEET